MKKPLLLLLFIALCWLSMTATASASWIWAGSHHEVLFNTVAKYVHEHFEEVSDRTVK